MVLRDRFKGKISAGAMEFLNSLRVDREMIMEDIWLNQAHVIMLERQGIVPREDAAKILSALDDLKAEAMAGGFQLKEELEDVHMNVESYVTEKAGQAGGKMHTARSRNDQVVTDVRMKLRGEILETVGLLITLDRTLLKLAEKSKSLVMPGYTHLQHAQPITLGFWASSYAEMFFRDIERMLGSYSRVNSSPLGACALSGTSFPIDRKFTARLLGFDSLQENALDAVSSRDFILESLSSLAILTSNLSRLSEELVLWSTEEFSLIEMPDEFSAGSSIMPQKKNPDLAELIRGSAGRTYGNLVQALTAVKGITSGYNRDLQEDRALLWDSFRVVNSSVEIMNGILAGVKWNDKRMFALVEDGFSCATELANSLVMKEGMPFRKAHSVTGKLVKSLIKEGKNFKDISDVRKLLKKEGIELSEKDLRNLLDPSKAVSASRSIGGTSPAEVGRVAKSLKKELLVKEKSLKGKRKGIEDAGKETEKLVREIV
ncbi:MAG: argininosuccinate lyase [Candidatus Altiarchaeales archaeon]|nr:argininosuccinate lyase [Candidatus Altiarchaeales archaeon]